MPTKKELSKRGKKSRARGQRFELKVRQDLERLGWVVSRWMNTVDYDKSEGIGKLAPAKRKYNPFFKALSIGNGFPDFVCFKKQEQGFDVIGIEVKGNGYLDAIERGMCIWLLENKIFSKILIAKKGKERGKIEYVDFSEKYSAKYSKR
jgi:transposase